MIMSWFKLLKRRTLEDKEPMDRVSTTESAGQDEEAAKRTKENEAELLARIQERNRKARQG